MKLMLISVLKSKEVRVAIVNSNGANNAPVLHNLHIEKFANRSTQGNIYKAKVITINEQLQAAFVDYGDLKHGLLTLDKVHHKYGRRGSSEESAPPPSIVDVLNVNDDILVQVDKDARVDKGATLTGQIQLHGQHVVLNTNRPITRISRQITGEQRNTIRGMLPKLKVPTDCGLVVRTSARRRSQKELQTDVKECVDLLNLIEQAYADSQAPRLLYESNNLVNSVLRDHLHNNIERVIIDESSLYEDTCSFVKSYMPDFAGKIELYRSDIPLYTKYRIESQVSKVFDRSIDLPSGGQIVLDPTEALLTIDVNSAQFKFNDNFRDMVVSTNLEAADEIFNQLRLRDIGGLIVVDFIDLYDLQDIRALEERVAKLCDQDRGRTKWEPISAFGLMELQRRRPRSSIYDTDFQRCDGCGGHGYRQTVESVGHRIFREIEARSHSRRVARIRARVTPAVAQYLTNDLRPHLSMVEMRSKAKLEIIPDQTGEDSFFSVESFSTTYSKSPIKTKSFEHGIPENGKSKKGKVSRESQAESIQTAVVQRPIIDRPPPQPQNEKSKKEKTVISNVLEGANQFLRGVTTVPVYLYKRLFVIDSKAIQPKKTGKSKSKSKGAGSNQGRPVNKTKTQTRLKKKVTSRSPNKATAKSSVTKRVEERTLSPSVPTSRHRREKVHETENKTSTQDAKAKTPATEPKKKRTKQPGDKKQNTATAETSAIGADSNQKSKKPEVANGKPDAVDPSATAHGKPTSDELKSSTRKPRTKQKPKRQTRPDPTTTEVKSNELKEHDTGGPEHVKNDSELEHSQPRTHSDESVLETKENVEQEATGAEVVEKTTRTDVRASNDPRIQPKANRPTPVVTS